MNNLEEWQEAHSVISEAWKDWNPHFEVLRADNGDTALAFFLLGDTNNEWELYQQAPEDILEDFADYMEDAKAELLEKVNYTPHIEGQQITESLAQDMTEDLRQAIRMYEKRAIADVPLLVYNMLFYYEWSIEDRKTLEMEYEAEMNKSPDNP